MKNLTKSLIGKIVTDYRINWIYASDTPASLPLEPGETVVALDNAARIALTASPTLKMRNSLSFADACLSGLALIRRDSPLSVAHFATFSQYDRPETWPLEAKQIALMDIATEDALRGQGIAPRMIAASTAHFLQTGASGLIAFIWWSNAPSVRAFSKAGWQRIGMSIEWQVSGKWHVLRFKIP